MNITKYIFLFAGAGLLFLLFRVYGLDTTIHQIMKIGWGGFLAICSIYIFTNIFLSYAWRILITYPVKPGKFYKFVVARIAGDATSSINALGAIAGEPLKAMYIKDIVPLKIGLATVFLDRFIHLISGILIMLTGLITGLVMFQSKIRKSPVTLIFILVLMLISTLYLFRFMKKRSDGVLSFLIEKIPAKLRLCLINDRRMEKIREIDKEIKEVFSSRDNFNHFYISFILHYFVSIISCALEIFLIVYYINPVSPLSFMGAVFVYIFGFIATSAFFFIPANVGTSEGSYSIALSLLGYNPVLGLSVGIIRRLRTFVWSGLGILFLLYAGLIKKEVKAD